MYSVGLNAPLNCGRRCFFHTLAKANAKANAPLKPERRAKSQNECPPNAPLNAPPAGSLLCIRFGASFRCVVRTGRLCFLARFHNDRPSFMRRAGGAILVWQGCAGHHQRFTSNVPACVFVGEHNVYFTICDLPNPCPRSPVHEMYGHICRESASATWQPFRHATAQCQVYNDQLV